MTEHTEQEVAQTVDARGLSCPLPLLKAKQAINRMHSGEYLRVLSTDPGSVRDFEVFARQTGHALLQSLHSEAEYSYLLRKQ